MVYLLRCCWAHVYRQHRDTRQTCFLIQLAWVADTGSATHTTSYITSIDKIANIIKVNIRRRYIWENISAPDNMGFAFYAKIFSFSLSLSVCCCTYKINLLLSARTWCDNLFIPSKCWACLSYLFSVWVCLFSTLAKISYYSERQIYFHVVLILTIQNIASSTRVRITI